MRFLQLNLNHCEAAQCLLRQSVMERKVDVALLSEPYKVEENPAWRNDATKTASIWVANGKMPKQSATNKEGFVRANISDIAVYSCYIAPRHGIDEFRTIVDSLSFDAAKQKKILITGDFNAWATEWGCPRTNPRGRVLLEALAKLDMVLLNQGNEHTYSRNGCGSVIDIAFASSNIANRIKWSVSDIYTHSDHKAIIIDYLAAHPKAINSTCREVHGWKCNIFDREMFRECLVSEQVDGPPEEAAKVFISNVSHACDMSMTRRRRGHRKNSVYWWNENIAQLRRECIRARRDYTRSRGRPGNFELHENFKSKKKELKHAIKNSKKNCFMSICDDLDNNPFGLAYKIVTKRLKSCNIATPTDPEALRVIVSHLFPPQDATTWNRAPLEITEDFPPVSSVELQQSASSLKDKKAPGLDGIPNLVVKEVAVSHADYLVALFNSCFKYSTFPSIWKRQKLVLLPKDGKPSEDPSSFRPICLIDTFGKLLECIICKRLQESVDIANGLSEYQFGFRKSKSTIDAIKLLVETARKAINKRSCSNDYCVVVTLDVKNAFNSANWEKTIQALRYLNIPQYLMSIIQDYFRNRVVLYDTDDGLMEYVVTGGVPQGSVLGPLLWNVMYNGILQLNLPVGVKTIGFADDIALVVSAPNLNEAKTVTNASISVVKSWLASMSLSLAEHKTEVVVISSRRTREYININIGDCEITSKDSLKYLGMIIDSKLSFKSHIDYVATKARSSTASLCRLMPNTRGPKYHRRKILAGVVKSIIVYASPVWADCMKFKSYCGKLNSVYRLTALRVCCAYRTVSDEAAFVIAGMIPVDLLAEECAVTHKNVTVKVEARSKTMETWQSRWSATTKGRWTHKLIPELNSWLERKHGDIEYYITQFLSGHGAFRKYLHRFGLVDTPLCPCCHELIEDAEHVFFMCPRFSSQKEYLQRQLGTEIGVGNIIQLMLDSSANWGHIANYVRRVLLELCRA